MKICLINNLFPPFSRGGAEQVVVSTAYALALAGHEPVIISTVPRDTELPTDDEHKIYRLGGFNSIYSRLNKISKPIRAVWHLLNLFDVGAYFKIRKILLIEKPDIVWTHNLIGLGFLTPLLLRQLKIRHYHTLHDIQLLHPSGLIIYGNEEILSTVWSRAYQSMCRALFGSPEIVISPSAWLAREHSDRKYFPASKLLVLPNPGPELTWQLAPHPRSKKFRFLFVGQLEPHKGIQFLVETFKKLNNGFCELLVVGTGSLDKALKAQTDDHYNIKLLGQRNRMGVIDLMRTSDCLIVPSLCYENSPTVIYEALSTRLPVIASSIGGIPELLHDFEELLFKPKDEVELSNKLLWAIGHRRELQHCIEAIAKQPILPSIDLVALGLK